MTPFAIVSHHNELLKQIRRRITELAITNETLEAIAGLQSGYASKVLADPPKSRMHPFVMFLIIEALGLKVHLVQDTELYEKLKGQFQERKKRRAIQGVARITEISRDEWRIRGINGGRARWRGLSAEQKAAHARLMNAARWQRARQAIVPASAESSPLKSQKS